MIFLHISHRPRLKGGPGCGMMAPDTLTGEAYRVEAERYQHQQGVVGNERTNVHLDSVGVNGVRELVRVNFVESNPVLESHTHPDAVEICYVTKGRQVYEARGTEYLLSAGWGFIAHANERHSSGGKLQEKNAQLYYMIIDTVNDTDRFLGQRGEDARALAEALNALPQRFYLGLSLKDRLDELFSLYIDRPPMWNTQLRCAVFDVLRRLVLTVNAPQPQKEISLYTLRTLNYIEDHIMEADMLSLKRLADNVYLSVPQLTEHFRRDIGSSPHKYINKRRMSLAQDMLLEGRSVTEVAYALDFSSSQHFSNAFRLHYDCSPRQWLAGREAGENAPAEPVKPRVSL